MGQTSSQLEPPIIKPEDSVMAEPRKKKKKVKKGKKVAQAQLEQEQESARALIQLAQGNATQDAVPDHDQTGVGTARLGNDSQHQYGPDMTSQDMMMRMSQDLSSDNKSKKRKKTQTKSELKQILDQNEPFTRAYRKDQDSADQGDWLARRATHPLDDLSTDDEVEMIGKGTQNVRQSKEPSYETPQPRRREPFTSREGTDGTAGLPPYSASQRTRAQEITTNDRASTRKKRKRTSEENPLPTGATDPTETWLAQVIDSQPLPSGDDNHEELDSQSALAAMEQEVADPADPFDGKLGKEVPIDPELHSMSALAPTAQMYQANAADDGHPSAVSHDTEIVRKRRRVEELQNFDDDRQMDPDSIPYYSPYAGHQPEVASTQQIHSAVNNVDGRSQPSNPAINSRSKKTRDLRQVSSTVDGNVHFGQAEINEMELYRDRWVRDRGMAKRDFNEIIQANMRGNPSAVQVFKDFQEMFPHQRPSYIQRFSRRKFHNFSARGTWTPAEDEELRQAVTMKGTAWKQIGAMIERFPEDCRDRWRNYLVNTEHRNREQWTDVEIVNLASAIMDCMRTMRPKQQTRAQGRAGDNAQYPGADSEQERSDMSVINWQAVSDRMGAHGGGRSRLQCSFKWSKLKPEDRSHYLDKARAAEEGMGNLDRLDDNATKTAGWRLKSATKKVANMLAGDRYDLLQALLHCGAPKEGNIPWKTIGERWWQERWTTIERKAAWLMMKRELSDSESMDYRDAVYRLLDPLLAGGIDERWDPAGYEPSQKPTKQSMKKERKAQRVREQQAAREARERKAAQNCYNKDLEKGIKSREIVVDSDDEDGGSAYQPDRDIRDDHNRFDPLLTPGPRTRNQGLPVHQDGDEPVDGGSSDNRDSLFDEPEEDDGNIAGQPDGNLSQDLAQRVLGLRNAT